MPAIVITKEEALGLLVKWKSDATQLAFLFDLADENGKSKLTGHWEGLALSMTGSGIVTDLTDSALLLRTIDNQHSVIVSLETAVFGYVEPRDQEEGLTREELEDSRRIERTLRIVLHQDAVLSLMEPK
jgi:hypothetical protein